MKIKSILGGDGLNRIVLEGKLDMDAETEMPKLMLDDRDLWNMLDEYFLDGSTVKITIEEIE